MCNRAWRGAEEVVPSEVPNRLLRSVGELLRPGPPRSSYTRHNSTGRLFRNKTCVFYHINVTSQHKPGKYCSAAVQAPELQRLPTEWSLRAAVVKQKAKQKKEKKEIELNAVLQPPLTTYTAKKHFCKNPTPASTQQWRPGERQFHLKCRKIKFQVVFIKLNTLLLIFKKNKCKKTTSMKTNLCPSTNTIFLKMKTKNRVQRNTYIVCVGFGVSW